MAEAMALALVGKLGSVAVGKLETMAKEKFFNYHGLLVSVQSEAEKLQPWLLSIKAVLRDAELRQMNEDPVKVWMESLKQIMYDADDVLDEWHTRASIFQSEITDASEFSRKLFSFLSSKYCSCFEPFLPILFSNNFHLLSVRIDIARRIQDITTRSEDLCGQVQRLKLISIPTPEVNNQHIDCRRTSSIVNVLEVFGRDADKKTIVSLLLSESSEPQNDVHVISIWGTAGFGKTTLAKLVLEDGQVVTAFKKQNIWWVCVSEPFDRERVAREITEQATEKKHGGHGGLTVLHQSLKESVRGKRFLLVLDDVWSEDYNDWDDLKTALACGERGSRILVTTRNLRVAKMMGSKSTHRLGELSDEGCWSLFQHIAFQGREEEDIKRLKEVGEQLVAKCGRVPVAVKILAAHMQLRTTSDWKNVLTAGIWEVKHQKFFPAFFLSYHALPSSLKQCFMYCSVFPKDKILEKDELVKLWMAQGFLESDGREELEMVGAEYFDDLAVASLLQDLEERFDGSIECKMHDLIHDFSQFLSGEECLVASVDPIEEVCSKQVRHMNVRVDNSSIYKAKNLRTLISSHRIPLVPSEIFNKLKCLRSLVLSNSEIRELPSEVGSLLHLRYLDLSRNIWKELPETVCNLYNLQTLKLDNCWMLCKLPQEIGKLSNLRHLDIRDTKALSYIPQSIGRLSQLRTLSKFIVSEMCKVGELGSLNHLSGTLRLEELRYVGSMDEAKSAELQKKSKVRLLEMAFGRLLDEDEDGTERMEGVLEGLQPDANLEVLIIRGYPGSTFPSWMSKESFFLTKLELHNCRNFSQLPSLVMPCLRDLEVRDCPKLKTLSAVVGKLQSLERLTVHGMNAVKNVWCDVFGISDGTPVVAATGDGKLSSSGSSSPNVVLFPNLTKLSIGGFPEWEEEQTIENITGTIQLGLRVLEIEECQKLKVLPHYMFSHSLKVLHLMNCPQLMGVQPRLPPLLERLSLLGDVGVLSKSLFTGDDSKHDSNSYPNLKDVYIADSLHSSLPQGLSKFTSLKELYILNCKYLDLKPEEELRCFPMLELVFIHRCKVIGKRCKREDWGNHLYHRIPFKISLHSGSPLDLGS